MVDKDWDKLKQAYGVNKAIGLPVCLSDLELEKDDKLEDVLEATLANQEMVHTISCNKRNDLSGYFKSGRVQGLKK